MARFEKFNTHATASCFNCGADFDGSYPKDNGYGPGGGRWSQNCPKCQMDTWYDLRISTEHIYPPIPWRDHDWSAVWDDYDGAEDAPNRGHIGYGATEEEAIADLIENHPREE